MPTGAFGINKASRAQIVQCETIGSEVSTGTSSSAAVTINDYMGKVTSEALTTAQNAFFTLTITNSKVLAADMVFASVYDGTNTQGTPMIGKVTPGAGTIEIEVINKHASAEAFNGTIVVSFLVVKAI